MKVTLINADGSQMPGKIVSEPHLAFIQNEENEESVLGLILATATFAGSDELGSPVYGNIDTRDLPLPSVKEIKWMTFLPVRYHYKMTLTLALFLNNEYTAFFFPAFTGVSASVLDGEVRELERKIAQLQMELAATRSLIRMVEVYQDMTRAVEEETGR